VSVEDLGREAAQLGQEAAQLLSLANIGEARSLSKLAELAVRQVPGCSAAHAVMWRDGELVAIAATHPDLAELADLGFTADGGPLTEAALTGAPVYCHDTLAEDRWPAWTARALRRGVRSSVHLARQFPPMVLVLALFGVRPGVLDADSVPVAEMVAGFGHAALASTMAYGEAQRTATQLRDSVAARAVTDQAKGILMHALGCTADEALRFMRRESQQRHVKVTDVAARVIATYGGKDPGGRQRRLPAVPASAFAGASSEPHEPYHEDDDRHPPQRVQREAQPAEQEGEQEHK
jgi:ANTAR domain